MMQDGRALQAGTSHYLGQNFSKSIGIQFQNRQGAQEYVHTTSWGASTRLLGALVMVHADDNGMKMPPKVAAHQIVIIPILRDEAAREQVLAYCEKLRQDLQAQSYDGQPLRVKLDARDLQGGDKRWEWIKKGAPILIEVGPRDIQGNQVCVTRRDQLAAGKNFMARDAFVAAAFTELGNVQQALLDAAKALMKARTATDIADWKSSRPTSTPTPKAAFPPAKVSSAPNGAAIPPRWRSSIRSASPSAAHPLRPERRHGNLRPDRQTGDAGRYFRKGLLIMSPFRTHGGDALSSGAAAEGFISVISWFSLLGIGLGVATLIIVMAVMNGFRIELFDRVLGLNGHMNVYATDGMLVGYGDMIAKLERTEGILEVAPIVEGQTLITKDGGASAPWCGASRRTVSAIGR